MVLPQGFDDWELAVSYDECQDLPVKYNLILLQTRELGKLLHFVEISFHNGNEQGEKGEFGEVLVNDWQLIETDFEQHGQVFTNANVVVFDQVFHVLLQQVELCSVVSDCVVHSLHYSHFKTIGRIVELEQLLSSFSAVP